MAPFNFNEIKNMQQSNTASAVTDDVMLEVSLEECIRMHSSETTVIMEGEKVDELMDWVFGPSLNEEVEQLSSYSIYQATQTQRTKILF